MELGVVEELLFDEVLWKLINDKWKSFARTMFLWNSVLNVLSIISLCLSLCAPRHEYCIDTVYRTSVPQTYQRLVHRHHHQVSASPQFISCNTSAVALAI